MIVEIVGPTGSGKTTLAHDLCQRTTMLPAKRLRVMRGGQLPFFASQFLSLVPTLLNARGTGRWFTMDEIKKMIYVSGWHSVLMQQSVGHNKVIVNDQGAIFKMAMLHEFGPPRLRSQRFDKWWNQAFAQWACVLDVVIWLNAPDEILIERIQTRNKEHKLQDSSSQAACSFLAKYRCSLSSVISKLSAKNRLRILNFDTHCQSFKNLTSEVFDEMKEKDMMRIEGPLGSFYLREESERPIILMSGGTGFAPIKGMIEHALEVGMTQPIHLYWGVHSKEDLYMHELAQSWTKINPLIRYTPVLSDAKDEDQWQGRTGYVHKAIMEDYPDLSKHEIYASGAPAMVYAGRDDFVKNGLDLDHYYSDAFEYQKD